MYAVMSVDLITPQIDRLPMAVLRLLTPLGPGAGAARVPTLARGPESRLHLIMRRRAARAAADCRAFSSLLMVFLRLSRLSRAERRSLVSMTRRHQSPS